MTAPRFSISGLLALTALIALGTAVGLAYRKNQSLVQERDALLAISSHLQVEDDAKLALSKMPSVADDFHSWHVHVPDGKDYELRLGIGTVFEHGMPPVVSGVPISAGKHRITLQQGDSPSEEFRYVVYIDGKQVIEKIMGSDWLPGGWASASGLSGPRAPNVAPNALHLSGRSYKPRRDFGDRRHFNGQSDEYVTRNGFRLWIDESDATIQPGSPFMGFAHDSRYQGIGLRDGLRFKPSSTPPYQWAFTRPSLETVLPVLRVTAEFFAHDGSHLSNLTQRFRSWQLRDAALGEQPLNWQLSPPQSVYSAFLYAKSDAGETLQPVVEMQWDTERPDEVGLKLADTPANAQLSHWRLRILEGKRHLWRTLQVGEQTIGAHQAGDQDETEPPSAWVSLDLGTNEDDTHLQWYTDETEPLQILERTRQEYGGMGLYKGLPLTLGIQIPKSMNPALSVKIARKNPIDPDRDFPGGAVFDEIQLNLEAGHDWIWLQAKPQE